MRRFVPPVRGEAAPPAAFKGHPLPMIASMSTVPRPSRLERTAPWLLALTVFSVPLVFTTTLSDPFEIPKRLLMLGAALLLVLCALASRLLEEGMTGGRSPALRAALVYLAASGVAIVPASNRWLAVWGFTDLAAGVALFWAASRFIRGPGQVTLLLRAVLGAAALVASGVMAQIAFPGFHPTLFGLPILPPTRGGSTLGEAGVAAQFLILAMPLGVGAAALHRGWARAACGGLLGLVATALVYAGRPEGWIAGAAAVALLAATRILQVALRRGAWRALVPDPEGASLRAAMVAAIVVLAVVAVTRIAPPGPTGEAVAPLRGVTLLSPTTGDPRADRSAAIPATARLIARHPVGVGPDHFRHAFLEVAWTVVTPSPFSLSHQAMHPGNAFLEITAESGVAGGIAFALLVIILLAQAGLLALRGDGGWEHLGFAAFNVLGALVLIAFLGAPFHEPVGALVFWVVGGLLQAGTLPPAALPAWLRRLAPAEAAFVPRSLRRRSLLVLAGAGWLALAAALGAFAWGRVQAAWWTMIGQAAYYSGQYQAALLALQQPAAGRTFDHLPHALAASAYLRLGHNDLAVREFEATLARSPRFLAAFLGRAAAQQALGRYDLADADLRAAMALWPDNADFVLALGRLEMARGRIDAAADQYRAALAINPSLAEAYFHLGEIFMRRARYDEAIEAFRICGTKNPRYPRLQLSLGDAYYQKGLYEMALRAYTGAASIDDRAVEPRLRIANVTHAMGAPCDAQEALEAARGLETDTAKRAGILELLSKVEKECRAIGARGGGRVVRPATPLSPPGGR